MMTRTWKRSDVAVRLWQHQAPADEQRQEGLKAGVTGVPWHSGNLASKRAMLARRRAG
jgi:hypothetical protein